MSERVAERSKRRGDTIRLGVKTVSASSLHGRQTNNRWLTPPAMNLPGSALFTRRLTHARDEKFAANGLTHFRDS